MGTNIFESILIVYVIASLGVMVGTRIRLNNAFIRINDVHMQLNNVHEQLNDLKEFTMIFYATYVKDDK